MSLIAAALALAAPPAPPPPVVSVPYVPPVSKILVARAGEVRCAGDLVAPLRMDPPIPMASSSTAPPPVALKFRVDASGRPLGIAHAVETSSGSPWHMRDIQPALAAWQFEAGPERSDCSVTFTFDAKAVEEIDDEAALRYAALSRFGTPGYNAALARTAFERGRGEGSTCTRPLERRRLEYAPADLLPKVPGAPSFTIATHDVDSKGKPVRARVLSSSGNEELDRHTLKALRASRFAPEERRGCVQMFRRSAGLLPAPPPIPVRGERPSKTCSNGAKPAWKKAPSSGFPEPFRRRSIEGWAIVRYDVAPWGQIGNVSVLAAEPASDLGEHAANLVRNASKVESATGFSGCVDILMFKLPSEDQARDEAED